jgi:hypothetical protein
MTTTRFSESPPVPGAMPEMAWVPLIPEEQWKIFLDGALALEAVGAPFVLHGSFAMATYTGRWRNTKDIDVVLRETDRERAIAALHGAGFGDYFEHETYDRSWIFRGFKDGVLFDVIWDLPNHRVEIDDAFFQRAQALWLRGRLFAIIPIEELIRIKLYVFQRERCDWVDVLNVIAGGVERIDWHWLADRMGRDLPLLHAALVVFNWMSPGRARALPEWLRAQFALPQVECDDAAAMERRRVALFDSRPWFALHQPVDRALDR